MIKFFNETATITYQSGPSVVEIIFNGQGNIENYAETIQVAEGIAQTYRAYAFLLEKHRFDDIDTERFGRFLIQWFGQLNERTKQKQRVALLVSPSFLSSLSHLLTDENLIVYPNVLYHVFTSADRVRRFLGQKEVVML